jgi:hypothetical protein
LNLFWESVLGMEGSTVTNLLDCGLVLLVILPLPHTKYMKNFIVYFTTRF